MEHFLFYKEPIQPTSYLVMILSSIIPSEGTIYYMNIH